MWLLCKPAASWLAATKLIWFVSPTVASATFIAGWLGVASSDESLEPSPPSPAGRLGPCSRAAEFNADSAAIAPASEAASIGIRLWCTAR